MNILIKQAKVICKRSSHHSKTVDILIEGGFIKEIKKSIETKGTVKKIEAADLCVSSGWMDMQAVSGDPGFEHKENLSSLIKAAAAGGFTALVIHNNNQPALHSKSQIEYILSNTTNKLVSIYPCGTVSADGKGKDLSEMYDMKLSGAIAFSDYKHPIKDAGLLVRALQYANNINALIITHCNDESISHKGQMNEGEVSTGLGLKGIPALAEELMLQRNLAILEYSGGKLHIPTISTKGSVELIKKAKAAGLPVTCGVSAVHLYIDDSALKEFDTHLKIDPPLRTKKDVQALRNAVETGIIDVMVSDHNPQDVESKELEFDLAEFGMINLQTAFSCALEGLKEKNIDILVQCLSDNPRNILGLKPLKLEVGEEADLTLFSMSEKTELSEQNNFSKSKNSPFFNKSLSGKVIGIVKGSKSAFN